MRRLVLLMACALALPAAAQEPVALRPVITEIASENVAGARGFAGVVQGENVVSLAFQTSGRVAALNVEAGDIVAAGDELASLDGITLEEDLAAARAAFEAAQAEATLAQQQYDRATVLIRRGIATEASLEQAQANRDAAAASLDSARADLSRAEDAASYGTLTAPRDGIILSTGVEPGTLVSPGTEVLELVDRRGREAVIDVPRDYVDLLPPDAEFEVRHHADLVAPVRAVLRLIEPVADSSLDTRRLRLTLIDPPADYRIGSLVTATFGTGKAAVVTLPKSAVDGTEDAPGVFRVGAGRVVEFVPIELGPAIGDRVVIEAGVAAGDEIVIRGANSLEDGQQVGERLE